MYGLPARVRLLANDYTLLGRGPKPCAGGIPDVRRSRAGVTSTRGCLFHPAFILLALPLEQAFFSPPSLACQSANITFSKLWPLCITAGQHQSGCVHRASLYLTQALRWDSARTHLFVLGCDSSPPKRLRLGRICKSAPHHTATVRRRGGASRAGRGPGHPHTNPAAAARQGRARLQDTQPAKWASPALAAGRQILAPSPSPPGARDVAALRPCSALVQRFAAAGRPRMEDAPR
eukprot:scaffold2437_cov395-Prasinococcus_capsulatus_cf.AAC.25